MGKFNVNLSQNWLIIVLLHILACNRAGNYYDPHAKDNTACIGVLLADSIMEAFSQRFEIDQASQSGGAMSLSQILETTRIINTLNETINATSTANLEASMKANLANIARPQQQAENVAAPKLKPRLG